MNRMSFLPKPTSLPLYRMHLGGRRYSRKVGSADPKQRRHGAIGSEVGARGRSPRSTAARFGAISRKAWNNHRGTCFDDPEGRRKADVLLPRIVRTMAEPNRPQATYRRSVRNRKPRLHSANLSGLFEPRLGVMVPVDAIGSQSERDHDFALRRMETSGATITTTQSLLFEWTETSLHPRFREISAIVKS